MMERRLRGRAGRARWSGRLVAGLLAPLLLFLAGDLHRPGDHEPLFSEGQPDGIYYPEAAHPDQPAHIEQATAQERPACAACLLRLQARGASLGPAIAVAPLPARERVQLPEILAAGRVLGRTAGARAPPLS